jgi:carboxyl-terminal processing protease
MKFLKINKNLKRIGSVVVVAIIVAAVVGSSYYLGFVKGQQQSQKIIVEDVKNVNSPNTGDFSLFWEVWNDIKSQFVTASSTDNNQNLVYGAISGLVSSLGDQYSVFFPPKDAISFNQEISGQFEGIGAEIGLNDQSQIVVIAPIKDTPAYNAGIKSGDFIVKINGQSTAGISVDAAVKQIRGPKGTTVTLNVYREGWKEPKDIQIVRDTIQVPTLDYKQIDESGKESASGPIAYIRIYNFYENSDLLFYQAALKAATSNTKGIIIDVRDNPGGYLDSAVNIAGWFVNKGKNIVTEEFRDKNNNEVFVSKGPSVFKNMPLVVLINKGSASASEILAGALKESDGGTIVGEKSFGKGTVQELLPLSGGSMLKLTIAHWLTPNGNLIDKNGIVPDIAIATPTSTATTTQSGYENNLSKDTVFQKALEVLVGKMNK